MDAKRGDWVRVHAIVLPAGERAGSVPEDTANVPLELWHKGFLLADEASIGDEVEVETYIGRTVKGTLTEVNPFWSHSYGKNVPELLFIGRQAREILAEEGDAK
ncbi:2-amino-4-ketopentanoate thiolase [Peptoniphilus sp. KCTC 25270]|uniref:2-amino-4-oxopentanoate thiolase subunit OrtA n=1 Tax=Peptoniphilus sp. KCTC 25270 TaxID=2897414 RepID=UPI001E405157|nr:2-amino-4-oxopentanoate thiolase subunit OrtA [Peptoniphilus sp. KCTC 25270]MCD1147065.1 2-amino-4-ketopentanoate thiolase [Peptoniphilus sp. KCTC 25270]